MGLNGKYIKFTIQKKVPLTKNEATYEPYENYIDMDDWRLNAMQVGLTLRVGVKRS